MACEYGHVHHRSESSKHGLRAHVARRSNAGEHVRVDVLLRPVLCEPEIADLHPEFVVQKDVIKFDISMQNKILMTMFDPFDHLPEYHPPDILSKFAIIFDLRQQVPMRSILHHDKKVLFIFKYLQ